MQLKLFTGMHNRNRTFSKGCMFALAEGMMRNAVYMEVVGWWTVDKCGVGRLFFSISGDLVTYM